MDGTKPYLELLRPPFYWISEEDSGVYEAMNKGIERAEGDWMFFLGDDDMLFSMNTLSSVFSNLINKETDLIIGKVQYNYVNEDSHFIKRNNGIVSSSWSFRLWFKNSLHHQGLFYAKNLFQRKIYNTDYTVLADYDLNVYLYKSKAKPEFTDELIAVCRTNGISKGYNWKMYKEEILLKTRNSFVLLWPFFFACSLLKYLVKKKI